MRSFGAVGILGLLLLGGCAGAPSPPADRLAAARAARRRGELDEVVRLLESGEVLGPEERLLLGRAHIALGNPDRAEAPLYRVVSGKGTPAQRLEALALLGEGALAGRDPAGASSRFEEVLATPVATGRDRDRARAGLARAALLRGDRDAAREWLARMDDPAFPGTGTLFAELGQVPPRRRGTPRMSAPAAPSTRDPVASSPARRRTPQVLSRSRWRARAAKRSQLAPMGAIRRITVHHTAEHGSRPATAEASAAARMRAYQAEHQSRWADIGYHFVIDGAGRIWEGRELRWQGAHAGSGAANRHNVGIALMGNFETASPSRPQVDALERLARWLCGRHRIPTRAIAGHDSVKRDHGLAGTACPGRHLRPHLQNIRRRLAREMAGGPLLRAAP